MSKYQKYQKYYKFLFLAFVVLAVVGLAAYGHFYTAKKNNFSDKEAVKAKTEKFINENLVAAGTRASIKDMIEENGLYKITVGVGDKEVTAYVSEDGKNFFPQVFNMDSDTAQKQSAEQKNNQPVGKRDTPEVELFVMSYCPYGLQAEKGILPIVDLLGSKIKFSLKFVDYAMHGEKEIDENLRQYCIEQQGLAKLTNYLKCFTDKGDSAVCLSKIKSDTNALNSCIAAADAQFKVKENFKNQSSWVGGQYPPFNIYKDDNVKYGVQGSPTLVVNGTTVSSGRDSQSILTAICSGFSNPPAECGQKLSANSPSPGFGAGTDSDSEASCGN
jgi:hypothetical protein